MKLKSVAIGNTLYIGILALALVALGIGFTFTSPSGEQSKLAYEGDLWCVSNYIEARDADNKPIYLKDGRPRKDERLDDRVDWIRKEQVEADTKEEAETKATSEHFKPSNAQELRGWLDANDKDNFVTHFNTGATTAGPCIGSGYGNGVAGKWVNDGINEDCFGISANTGSCEVNSEPIEIIGKGNVDMPASGKIVQESHLVTKEESFQPSSTSDGVDEHYRITQEAIGMTFTHNDKWTPAEGGGNIGQGSGGPPPATVEPWVMNMYWKDKPAEGTRVIITNPSNGKSVVAAAGYETGPSTSYLFGAQEEVMQALGVTTGSTVTVGFAKDQGLRYGPIDCTTAEADSAVASSSTSGSATGSGQTVVIDPGHGSAANTRPNEDKIMMQLGKVLAAELGGRGYKTILTHSSVGEAIGGVRSGENADNVARAAIANNAKPAITIRLHSDDRSNDVFQVIYPDRKGNDRTGFAGPLSDIVIPKSKEFASILKSSLTSAGYSGSIMGEGAYTSAGKSTLLILSAHSKYPVVTLEVYGNRSSALNSKYSQTSEQQKLAKAIANAVVKFSPKSSFSFTQIAEAAPEGTPKISGAPDYCPDEPIAAGPTAGEDYQKQIAKQYEQELSKVDGIDSSDSSGDSFDAPSDLTKSADAIVEIAKSQIGYQGSLCPNGKRDRTKYDGCAQWCAFFATWVYKQAGYNIPSIGGSKATLNWFKSNGHYVFKDVSASAPGDIIVWDRGGEKGHIAIVTENDKSKGAIIIVEGNTSNDTVKQRSLTYEQARNNQKGLVGLGRWKDDN